MVTTRFYRRICKRKCRSRKYNSREIYASLSVSVQPFNWPLSIANIFKAKSWIRRVDGIGSGEYANSVLNSFNISMAASTRVSILEQDEQMDYTTNTEENIEIRVRHSPHFGEKFSVNVQETEQKLFVNLQKRRISNINNNILFLYEMRWERSVNLLQ